MSQVCGCVVATGPGNFCKDGKAGTSHYNAESHGCSRCHGGWDQCWYPPFSGEEGEENVAPRANRQTKQEEAQGRSSPGPHVHDHSCRQREGNAEGDEGMGSTMMMSGRVGKEWDDDQTKWDAGDGTSTTTCNKHQMEKRRWGRRITSMLHLI